MFWFDDACIQMSWCRHDFRCTEDQLLNVAIAVIGDDNDDQDIDLDDGFGGGMPPGPNPNPKPKPECGDASFVGDGYCDDANNLESCGFDGGDCCRNDVNGWNFFCEVSPERSALYCMYVIFLKKRPEN